VQQLLRRAIDAEDHQHRPVIVGPVGRPGARIQKALPDLDRLGEQLRFHLRVMPHHDALEVEAWIPATSDRSGQNTAGVELHATNAVLASHGGSLRLGRTSMAPIQGAVRHALNSAQQRGRRRPRP